MRDSWPEFAARCEQAKYLSPQDARHVDTLAAFSELIGNNDRHFENISLLIGEDGEYQGIAPAYDILPMRYASIGGGVDPAHGAWSCRAHATKWRVAPMVGVLARSASVMARRPA
jgi:serine/threonine protein kinase HipA of HipAB toxin-antitoxin module